MGKIRARADNEKLFFDFTYLDKRCREQTTLPDTPANRKKLEKILERIEAEITLGSFDYATYFPQSSKVQEFARLRAGCAILKTPPFRDFAERWFDEKRVEWRDTHTTTVRQTLDKYLLPTFGRQEVSAITKAEILSFRSALGKVPGLKGQALSATRINHIMTPLRMILSEAADRFEFTSPYLNIKSLKVPKTDVEPFTLDEVLQILGAVREDFRNYYTVRFFTGMRTGEVDGLQWKFGKSLSAKLGSVAGSTTRRMTARNAKSTCLARCTRPCSISRRRRGVVSSSSVLGKVRLFRTATSTTGFGFRCCVIWGCASDALTRPAIRLRPFGWLQAKTRSGLPGRWATQLQRCCSASTRATCLT